MKRIFIVFFFYCGVVFSQTGITYQAVILNPIEEEIPGKNNSNSILTDQSVCLQFTISTKGVIDYQETIKTKTDKFGMVNVVIGSGTPTSSQKKFELIDWTIRDKTLKVELDISGNCSSFIEISSSPFNYTPYSLIALNNVISNPLILPGVGSKITYDEKGLVLKGELATADDIVETSNKFFLVPNERQKLNNLSGINTGDETDTSIRKKLSIENVVFPASGTLVAKEDSDFFLKLPVSVPVQDALALKANSADVNSSLLLKENVSNKSSTTTLGTSDILFPTQNAVKTYVDNNIDIVNKAITTEATTARAAEAANVAAIALKEDAANKSNDSNLGVSDKLFPTQNAVKTYVDNNIDTVNKAITTEATTARAAEAANVAAIALKEDTANKSSTTTLGTSDKLFPTQNAVKTYVDGNVTTLNNAITAEAATARAAEAANVSAIGLKEDTANKSSTTTLGTSDKLFPTQNAVKTYIDNNIDTVNKAITTEATTARAAEAANVAAIALKEDTANKSSTTTLGTSDKLFPTQNAVKTYVDNNIDTVNKAITTEATTARAAEAANVAAIALKEDTANKSNDSNLGVSDKLFPTQNAVKTYVDGNVTTLNNAITAEAATARAAEAANVSAIGLKEDTANKSNDSNLGVSDKLFPTQNAVKTYVDAKIVDGIADGVTTSAPTQNAVYDALNLKLDISKVGVNGGTASLDLSGKIPMSQIPSISFASVNVVKSLSEMLALTSAVKGSIAIRTDNSKNYVLADNDPTLEASWIELITPSAPVSSVNGKIGSVILSASDFNLGNVDNTSDLNKPISTATQTALNAKANLASPTFSGTVNAPYFSGDGSNLTNITAQTSQNIKDGLAGEILYQTSPGNTGFVKAGLAGQVLKSNGSTLPPTWVDSNQLLEIPEATDSVKGGVKISGDLIGSTFDNLIIANDRITTNKILDTNVTYGKIQNVSPNRILGNTSSSSASIKEIELTGSGKVVLNDSPTFINPSLGNATATSIFTSGLTLGYKEVSASTYQVATDDAHYIKFLTSGTSVILPSAVGIPGRRFVFTADLKIVVFQAKSGETIDKLSVFTFANDVINSILVVFSDGANWVIESSKTKN